MATKIETAKDYLAKSIAADVDGVLALVTDDVVLNRGMMGTVTGKDAVAGAIRNRPVAAGAFAPAFDEPVEAGDVVTVKGNLPPGSPFPVPSLTWTFSFSGDKIAKVEIGF